MKLFSFLGALFVCLVFSFFPSTSHAQSPYNPVVGHFVRPQHFVYLPPATNRPHWTDVLGDPYPFDHYGGYENLRCEIVGTYVNGDLTFATLLLSAPGYPSYYVNWPAVYAPFGPSGAKTYYLVKTL